MDIHLLNLLLPGQLSLLLDICLLLSLSLSFATVSRCNPFDDLVHVYLIPVNLIFSLVINDVSGLLKLLLILFKVLYFLLELCNHLSLSIYFSFVFNELISLAIFKFLKSLVKVLDPDFIYVTLLSERCVCINELLHFGLGLWSNDPSRHVTINI